FFSSRRRHTRLQGDWSSDVCSSDLLGLTPVTFAMLLTGRVAPDQYTAAMSVYNSAIDLGLFAGPLLGAAAARFSVAAPFLLALPLGLTAVAIGLRAPRQAAAVAPAPR